MIGRLIRGCGSLFLYFCIGTVITQVMMGGYLLSLGKINREKVIHIVAILHGVDTLEIKRAQEHDPELHKPEQPSLEDIAEAKAEKDKVLTLREQALENGTEQLSFQRQQFAKEVEQHRKVREKFAADLKTMQEGDQVGGRQDVTAWLMKMEPTQAKEQLMLMLTNDEMDEVVLILKSMSDTKRAEIGAEFTTEEEIEKLSEILRQLREGKPQTTLIEKTKQQLSKKNV